MIHQPKSFPGRLRHRLLHIFFLTTRSVTLGVKVAVFDDDDRVFLVRHSYVPGWHFPGGGVEVGETFLQALERELEEEACVRSTGTPALHGLYFNGHVSRRDHVAVYVIRDFEVLGARAPDREIEEARFFPRRALPEGASAGTRSRLAEIFDGAPLSDRW